MLRSTSSRLLISTSMSVVLLASSAAFAQHDRGGDNNNAPAPQQGQLQGQQQPQQQQAPRAEHQPRAQAPAQPRAIPMATPRAEQPNGIQGHTAPQAGVGQPQPARPSAPQIVTPRDQIGASTRDRQDYQGNNNPYHGQPRNDRDNLRTDHNRDDHHDDHDNDHQDNDHRGYDHNNHQHGVDVNVNINERTRYVPVPQYYYSRDRHAHRYYYSHYYSTRYIYVEPAQPYVEVRCDSSAPIVGTVVGGLAGGLIGNQFGHGGARTINTIGGSLLGAIIGRSIDRQDESCAYQALEYAQPNTQVVWASPEDNYSYTVTPGAISRQPNGQYCREYQAQILVGDQLENGYGTACRMPDGSWQIQN